MKGTDKDRSAWLSPWRDVPHPKYVPSLYCDFGASGTTGTGAAAASSATAGTPAVAAGVVAAIGDDVSVERFTDRRGAFVALSADAFVTLDEGLVGRDFSLCGVATGSCGGVIASDGASIGLLGGEAVEGAGITGLRAAACTVKRSAADFVRTYPAVYTASTAAELSATRPFETFLWG